MQQRCRHSQQRWAMQGASECLRKRCIPHRRRRRPVHCAVELWGRNDVRDQPDEIVALDPRHPLFTAADRAAEAELERSKQIAEHPALSAKYESDAQPDDANPELFGFSRRAFPGLADAMAEAALAAVELRQRLISPGAVPSHRRATDHHGGTALQASA